jgi:hypothetical protein
LEEVLAGGASRPWDVYGLIVGTVAHQYGRKRELARSFNLTTGVAPSSLLARARRAASENGATLVGAEKSGRFSHEMVRGEYRMVGQTVIVTITDKHWMLPWPVIEAQLRELLQ